MMLLWSNNVYPFDGLIFVPDANTTMIEFEGENYRDLIVKIVLAGDPAVGKTSLRKRYLGEGFKTSYLPTLGADFAIKHLKFGDVTLQTRIWDLAGQHSFRKVRKHYLKNASGALLLFDLTRRNTFDNLSSWLEEIYAAVLFPFNNIPIVIIGNKSDLDKREISNEEIEMFINSLIDRNCNVSYIETSAKTGYNVPVTFEKLCQEIVNKSTKDENK